MIEHISLPYRALILTSLCILAACGHTPSSLRSASSSPIARPRSPASPRTRSVPSTKSWSSKTKLAAKRVTRTTRGRNVAARSQTSKKTGPIHSMGRTRASGRRRLSGFPDRQLKLCPGLRVSNAPRSDRNGVIKGYRPFIMVRRKVRIAVSPTLGACLSSGFGRRRNRVHKGVDFQSKPPSVVRAAGRGSVVEVGYRRDYGNYVLINHGNQVFTRYAHLRSRPRLRVGQVLKLGAPIGMMGNSGGKNLAIHLHYELLIGDYYTPQKSFGLKPKDPFSYPYIQTPSP